MPLRAVRQTKPDKRWVRENIITVRDLPGVPRKWYVKVHRLAEPYVREALRRAMVVAPEYKLERFGCWVFRHIRHDPARPLSMHSWGIALDQNPATNFARTFKRGTAPAAWSDEYNAIWPDGVPRAWVEVVQSVGFAWGSDWDEDSVSTDHTYLDSMHFELVQRGGQAHAV
jgi:hypothetical protein